MRIDAFNHDQMVEAIGRGLPMNKMQEEAWEELQAKRPWMAELTRQIAAAMNIDKMPEMAPPMINTDMDEELLSEADEESEENFATNLGNAIMAITNNDDLSTADKRKKVLGALKLMDDDDDEIPGIPPPQTIYTDMNLAAPTEAFDQASLDRLPSSDRPFIKLSTEQTKTMCEQVIKILKVTREQEERDKQAYREMYGEEMPEM